MTEGQPGPEHTRSRTRYRNRGCGCGFGFVGFGSFVLVLTVGIVLSLFNLGVGIGASVRIPFTQSNLTVAASLGAKSKTTAELPGYAEGRLGGNQNLFNNSTTMTIGPAEGAALIVVGRQDGAPAIDLHLVAR
jgi:hypothetical protein